MRIHLLTGALLAGTISLARADQAIVIGINHFQYLPQSTLKGCVNDANDFSAVLTKLGYMVHPLLEKDATHDNIVKLFKEVKSEMEKRIGSGNKPSERFVFFFAGHGAQQGHLVCHDTTKKSDPTAGPNQDYKEEDHNTLSRSHLKALVLALPATDRTVILDACFSESMIATKGGINVGETVRAVDLEGLKPEEVRASVSTPDSEDRDAPVLPGIKTVAEIDKKDDAGICYWTAALRTEKAIERIMPELNTESSSNKPRGVFSYYAAQELSKSAATWGEINAAVRKKMLDKVADRQRPAFTPSYEKCAPLQPKDAPAKQALPRPPAAPRTVWDDFNRDHVDTSKLALKVDPDKAIVVKNTRFGMNLDAGFEGWLVTVQGCKNKFKQA